MPPFITIQAPYGMFPWNSVCTLILQICFRLRKEKRGVHGVKRRRKQSKEHSVIIFCGESDALLVK